LLQTFQLIKQKFLRNLILIFLPIFKYFEELSLVGQKKTPFQNKEFVPKISLLLIKKSQQQISFVTCSKV
jgi:hypothetical protein